MKKLPINTQNKDVVVSGFIPGHGSRGDEHTRAAHHPSHFRVLSRRAEGLKIKDNLCKLEHNKYDNYRDASISCNLQEFRSGHYNGNVRGVVKTILQVRGRQAMVDVLLHIKS